MPPFDFETRYGHGLLDEVVALGPATVVTMPDLWPLFRARFGASHRAMLVTGIEQVELDEMAGNIEAGRIIGLGGGTAIDAAKYAAHITGNPLISVPTVASVDACFTAPAAVRVQRKVRYVGQVIPELVAIDFDVIRAAPSSMNRVGIGDLLSCHTGLWDWRAASAAGSGPPWDRELAAEASALLSDAMRVAPKLATGDAEAVRLLFEGFRWVGRSERRVGHCRFEEGSEHYYAYCIEAMTGKRPPHGHLVCQGVLLMSVLQGNDSQAIATFLRRCGIDVSPAALGFEWHEVEAALLHLGDYVVAEGHAYSVVNERPVDRAFLRTCERLLRESQCAGGGFNTSTG